MCVCASRGRFLVWMSVIICLRGVGGPRLVVHPSFPRRKVVRDGCRHAPLFSTLRERDYGQMVEDVVDVAVVVEDDVDVDVDDVALPLKASWWQ